MGYGTATIYNGWDYLSESEAFYASLIDKFHLDNYYEAILIKAPPNILKSGYRPDWIIPSLHIIMDAKGGSNPVPNDSEEAKKILWANSKERKPDQDVMFSEYKKVFIPGYLSRPREEDVPKDIEGWYSYYCKEAKEKYNETKNNDVPLFSMRLINGENAFAFLHFTKDGDVALEDPLGASTDKGRSGQAYKEATDEKNFTRKSKEPIRKIVQSLFSDTEKNITGFEEGKYHGKIVDSWLTPSTKSRTTVMMTIAILPDSDSDIIAAGVCYLYFCGADKTKAFKDAFLNAVEIDKDTSPIDVVKKVRGKDVYADFYIDSSKNNGRQQINMRHPEKYKGNDITGETFIKGVVGQEKKDFINRCCEYIRQDKSKQEICDCYERVTGSPITRLLEKSYESKKDKICQEISDEIVEKITEKIREVSL